LSPGGDTRRVKHVGAWVGWWLALFWFWLLLVGQWDREELAAAAIAAAIAASLAELARARTSFSARIPLGAVADLPQALGAVLVDFGILARVLVVSVVRRRVVRGELYSRELTHRSRADSTGPRAWTTIVASYSPNAFVLDIDPQTKRVLLHDLVRRRASEKPS
jgi:multisubunit Na+/H+ antiporter MnhE subunit